MLFKYFAIKRVENRLSTLFLNTYLPFELLNVIGFCNVLFEFSYIARTCVVLITIEKLFYFEKYC